MDNKIQMLSEPTDDDIVITLAVDEWETDIVKEVNIGLKLKLKNRLIIRYVDKNRPSFIVKEVIHRASTLAEIKQGLRQVGFKNVR